MIGNILISLVAGLASFVCFTALKVPFAVPLAFVVALTDLIPMIGATLGAIIVVLLTLFASKFWPTTVLVALFFVVYQQLENYLIAPRILRSTVNLSAAAVLLAGLIGATALGLVGALMAIPVAAALKVLLTEQLQARDAAEAKADGAPAVTGLAALDTPVTGDDAPADRTTPVPPAPPGATTAPASHGATPPASHGATPPASHGAAWPSAARPSAEGSGEDPGGSGEDEGESEAWTPVSFRGSAKDVPRSKG
jgi:hypothetical protein